MSSKHTLHTGRITPAVRKLLKEHARHVLYKRAYMLEYMRDYRRGKLRTGVKRPQRRPKWLDDPTRDHY